MVMQNTGLTAPDHHTVHDDCCTKETLDDELKHTRTTSCEKACVKTVAQFDGCDQTRCLVGDVQMLQVLLHFPVDIGMVSPCK